MNVVSLSVVRAIKQAKNLDYTQKIHSMSKVELLEEMVRFQQKRTTQGAYDQHMMLEGKILFQALEKVAETEELRTLSKRYQKHLTLELEQLSRKL